MNIRQSQLFTIVFAGALAVAGTALAQPAGTGPVGPGPVGSGPGVGPSPMGAGTLGLFPPGLTMTSPMIGHPMLEGPWVSGEMGLMFAGQDPRRPSERDRENRIYDEAQRFLNESRWDRAIERFADVIAIKGTKADASLYWKAYAQNRVGQRTEALASVSALSRDFPNSRYLKQARALEGEVKREAGQPVRPDSESDDDLKLMALNALANSDPEQALPMLEKILEGNAAPRLKAKALFVLAQSNSPRAREVLKGFAKGNSTPELQSRAIDYLGVHGGRESRAALAEVYGATTEVDVKRRILRAFMVSGEKDRLLTAAQSEQNAELRAEAVQQLGAMGAHDELWQLYQKESAVDVKKRIIRAMFVGGNATRMIELAKTEQNAELRRTAVQSLGIMDSKRTSDALVEIYHSDKDAAIRKSVVQGLFQQSNATALVALARKESDPAMKRDIVQKLSVMGNNPVATAYMLELLNDK